MTFSFHKTNDFTSPLILSMTMSMDKQLECKDHQIHSKMLRKIFKKEV